MPERFNSKQQHAPATYAHMRGSAAPALDNKSEPKRRSTVHALDMVLLPHPMNTYGGYDRSHGPTWHVIDDKHRGWFLHYVWNSRLTGGKATITHYKSALKRRKSKETSQRWARKLARLGLVEKENVPDKEHGGFAPNEYRPLDPAYPLPQGDALAVVYGGQVRVLTAQPLEIPPVPQHSVRAEKPKPGKPLAEQKPVEELPLPSAWNMMAAQKAGLHDRLEIALLWADYQRRIGKGEVKNTRGYWVGMCQKHVEDLRKAGKASGPVQSKLQIRERSPEQEREARNRYMTEQAAILLANGYAPPQAAEQVMRLVYPANLCRTSGPTEAEAMAATEQAKELAGRIRAELEQRRRPTTVSAECQAWLRRQYQDLCSRPVTAQERQLLPNGGAMTPRRAAMALAALPGRPDELRTASAEQIEQLLAELNL